MARATHRHATTGEEVYEQFWGQALELERTDERELSTVLLLPPRFAMYSPGGWDVFADTLNQALTNLGVENSMQLVFFHPEYTFRDGKARRERTHPRRPLSTMHLTMSHAHVRC